MDYIKHAIPDASRGYASPTVVYTKNMPAPRIGVHRICKPWD